jgi:hypothetical protein
MTAWNPVYRVKVNGSTVTSATLGGLTISSGRTDIYQQPLAGYCSLTLIETAEAAVPYEINDAVSIEVQDSTATYVNLFGGFITDLGITNLWLNCDQPKNPNNRRRSFGQTKPRHLYWQLRPSIRWRSH